LKENVHLLKACFSNLKSQMSHFTMGVVMKISVKVASLVILFSFSGPSFALSVHDRLGDWRKATSTERSSVASTIASRLNDNGISSNFILSCLNDMAGDGGLDQMKISEAAAACSVMR
jgi:hypothetical protein